MKFSVEMFGKTHKRRLYLARNLGLLAAALVGVIVCIFHGGSTTVSLAAFGASVALGAVLGFLFGIPSPGSKKPPQTNPAPATAPVNVAPPNLQPANAVAVQQNLAPANAVPLPPPNPAPANAVPANPPPANAAGSAGAAGGGSSTESNIEQVADWVTKLLLGGGLTQIKQIPPTVWRWAREVAIGTYPNARPGDIETYQAFAAGIMVYGFILGFFGGFLITKLQLASALSD